MSCIFCDICTKGTEDVIFKDSQVFAFNDINKASAVEHILVCPIDHIDNALEVKDVALLEHM